jgi:radical SAM superfamily enzyme YgiQ (UPF0313 family)
MKKGITARKVRESVSLIKQAGIEYTIYVLIGMPTETVEEKRQTLQLARELDANYVSVSVATPHVGTELYEKMIEMGKKLDKESWEDFFHQSVGTVLNENVTPAIIEEFLALNEMEGKKRTI